MPFVVCEDVGTRSPLQKATCSIDGCLGAIIARGWCRRHYARWYSHGSPVAGGTLKGALPGWIDRHRDHTGDECLFWPFSILGGRAKITFRGRRVGASRVMCTVAWGDPPSPSHDAAHSCGNGHLGCLNPSHLRWATKAENSADRLLHGTDCRGTKHGASRLCEKDVLNIRRLGLTNPYTEIASLYGVTPTHIRRIILRQVWRWL